MACSQKPDIIIETTGVKLMKSVFALTVSESKRLIARGVMKMPVVQDALQKGRIILAPGSTNVFIAEEITGKRYNDKWQYCFGLIVDGLPCVSPEEGRESLFVFENGIKTAIPFRTAVAEITKEDVFIKGANAVDAEKKAGVLVNHLSGGTVGFATPYLLEAQANVIIPVGLEKLIPSVSDAVAFAAPGEVDSSFGFKNWLMEIQIPQAVVVTEIEALAILADVRAHLMAAGGMDGSEGSVVLGIEGEQEQVMKALEMIRSIRGEPSVSSRRQACSDCKAPCFLVRA
jgi:hypothetical protein